MRKLSVKFWLLTQTLNQVLRLAILKIILRKKKEEEEVAAAYQPEDRLKEGTQIFILLSDQQKV